MSSQRIEKINRFLQKEITKILYGKIRDPRINSVAITKVETSRDLTSAKVHCEIYGSEEEKIDILKHLQKSKKFIRKEVASAATFKKVPDLTFLLDHTMDKLNKIDSILKKIKEKDGVNDNEV